MDTRKFINVDGKKVIYVHYLPFDPVEGLGKTEAELKLSGILVDSIPEPVATEGKIATMCYTPKKGVYYEYNDVIVTNPLLVALEQKLITQEQYDLLTN